MHPVFTTALEVEPRFRVCRLNLLPLTVGHLFVLQEFGSPFSSRDPKSIGFGDILLAAFVCSQPWRKSRKDLLHPKLTRFICKWGRKCRGLDLGTEEERFLKYRKHYLSCPTTEGVSFRHLEAPEEWTLLSMLISEFHYSKKDAMDESVSFATALWAANAERLGRIKMVRSDRNWLDYVHRAVAHQRKIDLAMKEASQAARN